MLCLWPWGRWTRRVGPHLRLIPLIGDVGLAAWKANSRNAHLCVRGPGLADGRLEAYLTIRGQEYLASVGQGPSVITAAVDGISPQDLRAAFAPGAGMDALDAPQREDMTATAVAPNKRGRAQAGQPVSAAPALPAR